MIITENLILRPITAEDNQQFFAYRSDAITNKYQGFVPKTLKEVDAFIAKNPSKINLPDSWFQFVIIEKETDLLIGDIGIHFVDEDNRQCELGITLRHKYHGLGHATEAVKSILNHLFISLNKHRVFASVDPNNLSSIALLKRLGFRKEAHFRKSLLIDDIWVDDVIYGLLKEEWDQ